MTSDCTVERHPLKEKRRANKPLLERKRRARINDSLADLKYLVLTSMNKDISKYTKMEKVDILDMTVRYLKGQRPDDYSSIYRAAYTDMYQNIMSMDGIDNKLKRMILSNLTTNQRDILVDKSSPPPSPTLSNEPPSPSTSPLKPSFVHPSTSTYEQYIYTMPLPVATERQRVLVSKDFLPYHHTTVNNRPTHHIPAPVRHHLSVPPPSFRSNFSETMGSTTKSSRPSQSSSSQVWRPW